MEISGLAGCEGGDKRGESASRKGESIQPLSTSTAAAGSTSDSSAVQSQLLHVALH